MTSGIVLFKLGSYSHCRSLFIFNATQMAAGNANELILIWTCDGWRVCESTILANGAGSMRSLVSFAYRPKASECLEFEYDSIGVKT